MDKKIVFFLFFGLLMTIVEIGAAAVMGLENTVSLRGFAMIVTLAGFAMGVLAGLASGDNPLKTKK